MQEVLLRASFIVALSSESATPATAPVNDGIQSAVASANWEKLARAEQRIWGDNLDALCLPMSKHPPPPRRVRPCGGGRDHRQWLWLRVPHLPPAVFFWVLQAVARRGGIVLISVFNVVITSDGAD